MWIEEVAPERVAELFHNYEHALRVFGKGSESGSWEESEHPQTSQMATGADAKLQSHESREYFALPGEAEWGC